MSLLLQLGPKSQSLLHTDVNPIPGPSHVDPTIDESEYYQPQPPAPKIHGGYTGCYGLPYQDHNYGAPPPPTPPVSPPPLTPPPVVKVNGHIDIDDVSCHTTVVTTTPAPPEEQDIVTPEDSVTRCICEFQHDDGYMICCDRCGVWQHVDCMGVDRLNIPEIYYCEKCEPRKVDKHRAIQLQTKRRELLSKRGFQLDSSATDTEDETQEGKKKKKDKAKQKKTSKKDKKENNKTPLLKGKIKLPKNRNKLLKEAKELKKLPSAEELSPTNMVANHKKKNQQTSPIANKKKKFTKTSPRSLSVDTGHMSSEMMHGGWSSPEGSYQNGLLSPPLPISSLVSAPCKEAQLPSGNQYSIEVETLLVGNKLNRQHKALATRDVLNTPVQLLVQLCKVVQINTTYKGLEALDDIATNQPIIEYKGSVMMKEQFLKENNFFAKPYPFVLFYKFDDLHFCVDASQTGCDACHVRRSCVPNTEVRHVVENGNLHFYLYSTRCISKGAELTIPFDYTHKECGYNIQCACTRQSCPIAKHHKTEEVKSPVKLMRKRRRRSTKTEDMPSRLCVESPPMSTSTPVNNNKANKTSTNITKRRKLSSFSEGSGPTTDVGRDNLPSPKPSPPKTRAREESLQAAAKAQENLREAIEKAAQQKQEEQHEDHKKMTREERKMDAILKAFEKMEKREERRKEALMRIDHTRKSTDMKSPEMVKKAEKQVSQQDVTTEEDIKPEKVEPKIKKVKAKGKKRRMSTPARRQRASSSISVLSAFDSGTSADECNTVVTTPQTASLPSSAEPGSNVVTPSCANSDKAFRFPKKEKSTD